MIDAIALLPTNLTTFLDTAAWMMWLFNNRCKHNYIVHDVFDRKLSDTEFGAGDRRVYVKRCTKCGHLHKQEF